MDPYWESMYGQEWIPPDNLGPTPIFETRTSAVDMKNQIYGHQNNVTQYTRMVNTDAAL